MVLGRTDKGLIKIKSDEEGGGLRAVNCACCSTCDPCTGLNLSNPLLATIKSATSVSATFNFPQFYSMGGTSGYLIPATSGSTGPLAWDGISAYWDDLMDPVNPSFYISLSASCLIFDFSVQDSALRKVTPYDPTYPSGSTFPCAPTDPSDPYIQYQFFTIPVNGDNIKSWQRPINMTGIPPAYYPVPTMSITFS
jgi:hypothetical protein